MSSLLRRRVLVQAGLALGTGLWATLPRACEVQLPNLRLMHPWTRATPAGADAAIINMSIQDVTDSDRLVGVQCLIAAAARIGGPQARPEVDLVIPAGVDLILGEDGSHVLLTGLRVPLQVGRVFPLLVMFEKAGIAMTSLNVDYPAAA